MHSFSLALINVYTNPNPNERFFAFCLSIFFFFFSWISHHNKHSHLYETYTQLMRFVISFFFFAYTRTFEEQTQDKSGIIISWCSWRKNQVNTSHFTRKAKCTTRRHLKLFKIFLFMQNVSWTFAWGLHSYKLFHHR